MFLVLKELAVTEVFHIIIVCFKNFLDDVATYLSLFLILWLAASLKIINYGMLQVANGIGSLVQTVTNSDSRKERFIKMKLTPFMKELQNATLALMAEWQELHPEWEISHKNAKNIPDWVFEERMEFINNGLRAQGFCE